MRLAGISGSPSMGCILKYSNPGVPGVQSASGGLNLFLLFNARFSGI